MSVTRFLLPVLAAAGTAYAASCSVSATTTIQNSGDATQLASCKTFSGSIAVSTDATDAINLSGIQKLTGDLVVKENPDVPSLSADDLETIEGEWVLDNTQGITSLSFPKLSSVDTIRWVALGPNLASLDFGAQIKKASKIRIENTHLQTLEGINVETINELYLANNRYINNVSMQLGNITGLLNLADNNPDITVEFPNLIWAFNMTFRNCSTVSLPSLETLNGSLGLYSNFFESFAAPNLTKVGGALALVDNGALSNISFPMLEEVKADLQIANNTELHEVSGLPELKTIGGAFDFNGNFTDVQTPALNDVKGAFNLQSTGDVDKVCTDFYKPLADKDKIQGHFECKGKLEEVGGQGTKPKSSKPDKEGAASVLNVQYSAGMGLMGMVVAFFL